MSRTVKNRLKITSLDETPMYLEVELNGRRVENLISLKVEVPSGKDTPLLKVMLEFYSALDLDAVLGKVLVGGSTAELSV